MKDRRQHILDTVKDSVSNLLYYDRKGDEELGVGAIEEAIEAGEITTSEIITFWAAEFEKGLDTK